MKKLNIFLLLVIFSVIFTFHQKSHAQQTVSISVVSSGGTSSSNSSYIITGTIGQPVTGTASGTDYNVNAGFWAQIKMITVGAITVAVDPVNINTSINASAAFTDPNTSETHSALWDWGDDTYSEGTVNGSGNVTGSHIYEAAGVYTITLTVTNNQGLSGSSTYQFVVVYDPSAGFVTGGGWINSPEGAYTEDLSLTGKAKFGFVSKYKKGADVPTGQTQFNFKVADLNFHSTDYQWLVVAGFKAKFKGSGTINNNGDYDFMLSAVDGELNGGGDVDKFRIKIWEKATEEVVYDNQQDDNDDADATDAIEGGSIVIHGGIGKSANEGDLMPADYDLKQNYPNPFNPTTTIQFQIPEASLVTLKIYNIAGQVIKTLVSESLSPGYYNFVWDGTNESNRQVTSGMYIYKLQAGKFSSVKRMLFIK